MQELNKLSMLEAIDSMKRGDFTPVELVQACIARVEEKKALNAYVTTSYDLALEQAKESEKKYLKGEAGLIEGIPIAVKDIFCTRGVRTTAGSRMLQNFIPDYESTVTQKLFSNGGVMVGKTNMDEFAMGSGNLNSYFGSVINPWKRKDDDSDLVPGGSSGGSAVAVASGSCLGALGTDTGGSVRQPASFTGVVGFKPTYGRCSRYGLIAFASSLDQAGVFARSVADAALLLQSICGYDAKDSTSKNIAVPNWSQIPAGDLKGVRIGIPREYRVDNIAEDVSSIWDRGAVWLKERGATIVDISLPHSKYALSTYCIIAPAEASSNLARYDGVRYGMRVEEDGDDLYAMISKTRALGFGTEVKRRVMIGTHLLSSSQYDIHCLKAQQVRALIKQDFTNAFEDVDAILTPATPSEAFAINEEITDPVVMYLNDIFTVTVNLAGLPSAVIPAGFGHRGLPLGLQVIGKHFDEGMIFRVIREMESAADFKGLL